MHTARWQQRVQHRGTKNNQQLQRHVLPVWVKRHTGAFLPCACARHLAWDGTHARAHACQVCAPLHAWRGFQARWAGARTSRPLHGHPRPEDSYALVCGCHMAWRYAHGMCGCSTCARMRALHAQSAQSACVGRLHACVGCSMCGPLSPRNKQQAFRTYKAPVQNEYWKLWMDPTRQPAWTQPNTAWTPTSPIAYACITRPSTA
eukprot:15308-Chlamydomonas_euryale.AAC.1